MSLMAVFVNGYFLNPPKPAPLPFNRRPLMHTSSFNFPRRVSFDNSRFTLVLQFLRSSNSRIRSLQDENANKDNPEEKHEVVVVPEDQKIGAVSTGSSFLAKLSIALVVAATVTAISIGFKPSGLGSSLGVQCLAEGSSTSTMASSFGFTFKAFGYRLVIPEYAPGWIYFWLLMAAGCGLFISEEALNIWVGISFARMLSLDGTWQSFVESFSRNAPYIISTVLWVYWGVCISDMIPFYLGKLFTQSGASDDVCSKLGIGKEKATSITHVVQRYGNLVGVVERFSLGVRNPTAFLAGALGISPEVFFAGVCCGGLITLPIQLGIGFLLRENPILGLATVATAVGIWTVFPYAVAAATAFFLFVQQHYSP